jgi:tetratricopeptide (TPR) repeat protein
MFFVVAAPHSIAYAAYGQYGRAIDDASKCIQINYRQIEGYYRLALAFHTVGQRDQALNTLYRGQEIDGAHNGITQLIAQVLIPTLPSCFPDCLF